MGEGTADWTRVRALVERALELDPDERAALLAAEDEAVAAEARALLEADAEASPFDADPVTGALDELLQPPAPERVGPYVLRRELGAGGMGRVFLGARADGEFHQLVAIKRLRVGLDDPAARERFRRERQVLANLRHPGIARLLDGGVAEDGGPYLVMEYVEGLPIDRSCDEARLTLRERLALFRQVCEAVHHAHQNLVVHRDIKPGNVLVTTGGEVKLCDFGIAKILDPEKSSAQPELTAPLQRLFTPSYASPEHLRGQAITTAADVYSLGVLLYELLTGRLPHELGTRSAAEVERTICEEEPERPSTAVSRATEEAAAGARPASAEELAARRRTTPRGLRRELAGDLDRIVLQALRKEPQRRYASAEQLGADVERYLRGLPVLARPDTALYRTSRFLARHRGAVGAASVALLLLVTGLVTSVVQHRRAERVAVELAEERDRAHERSEELARMGERLAEQNELAGERLAEVEALNVDLEQARAVAEERLDGLTELALRLVFDVHREIYALEGATRATELVLRTGLETLDPLGEAARGDPYLLRRLSGGYLRLGEVQGDREASNLGRPEDAWRSYERALELAQEAHALAPEDPANAFTLASAWLKRGLALAQRGDREASLAALRQGLEVCDELPAPWSTDALVYVGFTLHMAIAGGLLGEGRPEAAVSELERGEELLELLATWPQRRSVVAHERAGLRLLRARALAAHEDVDAALTECWEALAELEPLVASEPANVVWRRSLVALRSEAAAILAADGDLESARALLEENQAELEALAAGDPSDRRAALDLAAHYGELAGVHRSRADTSAELACQQRRLELLAALAETSPTDASLAHMSAAARVGLGEALLREGRLLEAVDQAQEARRAFEARIAEQPGTARARLGRVGALGLLAAVHDAMAARSTDDGLGAAERERAAAWRREAQAELDEIERRRAREGD